MSVPEHVPDPSHSSFSVHTILSSQDVPPEEYDSMLRKIAMKYKALEKSLDRFRSTDPAVTDRKKKAKGYVERDNFEQAEYLLNKAMAQDLEAARQLEDIADSRMLSAAASMAEIGE